MFLYNHEYNKQKKIQQEKIQQEKIQQEKLKHKKLQQEKLKERKNTYQLLKQAKIQKKKYEYQKMLQERREQFKQKQDYQFNIYKQIICQRNKHPSISMVVSRYNESITWANDFKNVIIYNKSNHHLNTIHPVVSLPNVGREGHTFYTHIVKKYEDLTDYTIFLQGNPFDHFPQLKQLIHQLTQHMFDTSISFYPLSTSSLHCSLDGCEYHEGLPLKQVFQRLFKTNTLPQKTFHFFPGGQFIVSKQQIKQRPKSFYEMIVSLLSSECDPIEGYVIERFLPLIFSSW